MIRKLILLVLFGAACVPSGGADWPAFRGPSGDGFAAAEETAPTVWSSEENIKWRVPLPRPGNGSAIVVGRRVLVASAEDEDGRRRSLYCLSADDGRRLWVRTVELDRTMPTHKTNPYCGSTPASDGRRVVVWHATAGLHCYDLEGNQLWSRDLGEFRHMWGYGTSPILHDGLVILNTGPARRVFAAALDLEDGRVLWETDEPFEGTGDKNENGKFLGSWTTPVVARVDGRDQAIVSLPTRVNAYDLHSGAILWSCDGLRHDGGDLAYSSPLVIGDTCFVTGGFRGPSMAIRLGGSGNVTETHRIWRVEKNPQSIGSGVVVDGLVYRPHAEAGLIDCVDSGTGDVLWQERAEGGPHWASIVAVGGLLYATAQDTTTVVFKPNPEKFELVAVNKLDDQCNATPAVSGGCLFIRAMKHLYCIGR